MSDFNLSDGRLGDFFVRKFGRNDDVDTGPEDIIDTGGLQPWPVIATTTTIVAANAADTAGGTGLRTARVVGLDNNFLEVTTDISMNGLTPVALPDYLRVYRSYGLTFGSGETNAGNIDILHGATVLARISAGKGQTLMAVFTIPADWPPVKVQSAFASLGKQTAGFGEVILFTRDFGSGGWRDRLSIDVHSQSSGFISGVTEEISLVTLEPRTDIRMTVQTVSANNTAVSGAFILTDKI